METSETPLNPPLVYSLPWSVLPYGTQKIRRNTEEFVWLAALSKTRERELAVSRRQRSREKSAVERGGRGIKRGTLHDVQRSKEKSTAER